MDQFTTVMTRFLFVVAFVVAGSAVAERVSNMFGYTTVVASINESGRLLEIASMAVLFVIALVLRDIKHALGAKTGK